MGCNPLPHHMTQSSPPKSHSCRGLRLRQPDIMLAVVSAGIAVLRSRVYLSKLASSDRSPCVAVAAQETAAPWWTRIYLLLYALSCAACRHACCRTPNRPGGQGTAVVLAALPCNTEDRLATRDGICNRSGDTQPTNIYLPTSLCHPCSGCCQAGCQHM